ncbi:four-carbon acid sugar kinase family protein [Streptomyces sp. NPDC048415]|uniref:four-carbon acid sugar kinase family protein n=1 Tax=Streptomyces sp. NPDC048415 TaxID=3154822 RepID=UPI00344537AB
MSLTAPHHHAERGRARRADVLAGLPGPAAAGVWQASLEAAFAVDGRRIVVLDDDPTGTQTVHNVPVVTRWRVEDLRWVLTRESRVAYVLTNTRSLDEAEATAVNCEVVANLLVAADAEGVPVSVVSRGDSTLRGHFAAETSAIIETLGAGGQRVDGVIFCPSYLEAGRVTVGDEHWIVEDDWLRPVADSHYATDATFSFSTSHLPTYVEEVTGGGIRAQDVLSIGLDDIRSGGPDRIAALLRELSDGRVAVVNALDATDLDAVVLAVLQVEAEGRHFLYRTGPSFVRARGGISERTPLRGEEIYPGGPRSGHGLVVVGSHVALTTLQVTTLQDSGDVERVELDVRSLLDPAEADRAVQAAVRQVLSALERRDVLLVTSRELVTGGDGQESLAIARAVSEALVTTVNQVVRARSPRYLLAKGGITSSDVFTHGLSGSRAKVLGSLLPGMVSVWQAEDGIDVGLPYVVFAGNVGGGDDLLAAVRILNGDTSC